jgi:UDP-GlcNAc:undecaprenyl-phosphate GlcNAc-1-phosphate transferase
MPVELCIVCLALVCILISAAATVTVKAVARKLTFVDEPHADALHKVSTPLGGGIAIFLAVWLPIAAGMALVIAYEGEPCPSWLPEGVFKYFRGALSKTLELTLLFLSSSVFLLLGLLDDMSPLKPLPKFLVELIVAGALVAFGFRVTIFIGEAEWWSSAICGAASALWIVGIANSMNLLDNMDGVAASVVAVVSLVFGLIAFETGQLFIALFLFAILGAVLGFLPFNYPPARIFMGDAGSLFLGFMLSVLTILFTFYDQESRRTVQTFFTPFLVLAVPLYDTVSVVLLRLREGRPLFLGDTRHFSHRLAAMGLGQRGALFVSAVLTFFCGLSAMLLYHVPTDVAVLVFVQVGAVIALLIALEHGGRST